MAEGTELPTDEVLYDTHSGVATITINREALQNTISGPMLDGLTELLLRADRDSEVRAIIITGTGRFFCAGLDLRSGGSVGQNSGAANLDLRSMP